MTTDLWTEAAYDADGAALERHVTAAKVAIADTMPFLLTATSEADFANRKAMAADRIASAIDGVVASRSQYEAASDADLRFEVRARLEQSIDADFAKVAFLRSEEARLTAIEAARAAKARDDEAACRARVEATLQTVAETGDEEPKGDYARGKAAGERDRKNGDDPGVAQFSSEETDYVQGYWEGYGRKSSAKTAAFPPGKDEKPHGTGTEVEHRPDQHEQPEHQQHHDQSAGADGPGRKVEQDPTTGEWVGSEWEDGQDGTTLVQSASTFGNNPRFKTEEEAHAWTAEGTTHEDADKPDAEPHEQPHEEKPEDKQSAPFGSKASLVTEAVEHSPKVNYPGSDVDTECSCGWKQGDDGKTLREHLDESRKTAASDTCPVCHGSGQVAAAEGGTDEGYQPCSACGGSGKVSQDEKVAAKTASSKATPAEGTVKDVGGGSLAEKATCANCGKGITKGVAQRTTGWVHQSGSKWCPEGATAAKTAAGPTYEVKKVHSDTWLPGGESTEEAGQVIKDHVTGSEEEFWLVRNNFNGAVNVYAYHGAMKGIDSSMPPRNMGSYEQFYGQPYREASLQTTASWVDAARAVVTNKQAQTVDGILLDLYSASLMVQVYDALNADNKAKFEAMSLPQAQQIAFRLAEKQKGASRDPFVADEAGEGVKEAFTRNDYGAPQAPAPHGPRRAPEPDLPGSVTYTQPASERPSWYGQGNPGHSTNRQPKDTAPVDGTKQSAVEAGADKGADEAAYVSQRGNELAERHRQEERGDRASEDRAKAYWTAHPDEYSQYLKDNPYTATLANEVLQRLADASPYSTSGNPYVPAQAVPGTPDDVLDGPVNPAPMMLDVPMTTRPRQMPSGDNSLPDPATDAAPEETTL